MNNDYGDNKIKCPLLDKEIYEAYCMDINLVRTKSAKPELIPDKINQDKADKVCKKCKYRPI
jgi:hypothetical protein